MILYEFSKEIVNEIISPRVVVIYAGRFQPFHINHYEAYKYLVNKFGVDNVYISTSNKVAEDSPFDFNDKKLIMTTMFNIPPDKIVENKSPYIAINITKMFVGKNTAIVYALGEKDAQRLAGSKHYEMYEDGKQLDANFREKEYIFVIPADTMKSKFKGHTISGTLIRDVFSNKKLYTDSDRVKLFSILYPNVSKGNNMIFKLFLNKIGAGVKESITEGGAFGHAYHPFEDLSLTFADIKNMVTDALKGNLKFSEEKCISGDSILMLKDNGPTTIENVVNKKIMDKVLSYDFKTNSEIYKDILNYFNNGNTDEWLEIELENGNKLVVTPNHRIYVSGIGYIKAEDITEDMELIVNKSHF